jgi:hypothetical protein
MHILSPGEVHAIRRWFELFCPPEGSHIMQRIEELTANLKTLTETVDRADAKIADLEARLEAAGAEDPAIGQAADAVAALNEKLSAAAPAPVVEPTAAGSTSTFG